MSHDLCLCSIKFIILKYAHFNLNKDNRVSGSDVMERSNIQFSLWFDLKKPAAL